VNWSVDSQAVRSVLAFVELAGTSASLKYAGVTITPSITPLTTIPSSASLKSYSTSLAALNPNQVLIAWLDTQVSATSKSGVPYTDQGIKYVVLGNNLVLPAQQYSLMAPNLRQADLVSVGADAVGNGIFIWSDYTTAEYLYYTLLDPAASIKTPAMIFTKMDAGITSDNGQALAKFFGREVVLLPFVRK
jgi:hypothetical protein